MFRDFLFGGFGGRRFWIAEFACGTLLLLFAAPVARAEIILDEFEEPLQLVLPDNANATYLMQSEIGPLKAERWSDVVATSGARPSGFVEAALFEPSALTIRIDRLNPHPLGGFPAVGINLLYYFNEMDITQGGANDSFVLEFAYLRSAIPLARVDVFVLDASQRGISYGMQRFNIPLSEEPFALDFPFVLFGGRGGGAERVDFHRAYAFYLTITPVYFTAVDPINFSSAIERIRFAHSVPEPGPNVLICSLVVVAFGYPVRKRRCHHEIAVRFLGLSANCILWSYVICSGATAAICHTQRRWWTDSCSPCSSSRRLK